MNSKALPKKRTRVFLTRTTISQDRNLKLGESANSMSSARLQQKIGTDEDSR
jgi:hypothetical protein